MQTDRAAIAGDFQNYVGSALSNGQVGLHDSRSELDPVDTARLDNRIAPIAARKTVDIVAAAAAEQIIALAAREYVAVRRGAAIAKAGQHVIAAAARDDVAARAADQHVGAFLARDQIVAKAAVDRIVIGPASQPVTPGIAVDRIVAAIAEDLVVERSAAERIARIAVNNVDRIVDRDAHAVEVGGGQRSGADAHQPQQHIVQPGSPAPYQQRIGARLR